MKLEDSTRNTNSGRIIQGTPSGLVLNRLTSSVKGPISFLCVSIFSRMLYVRASYFPTMNILKFKISAQKVIACSRFSRRGDTELLPMSEKIQYSQIHFTKLLHQLCMLAGRKNVENSNSSLF